MLLENSRYIPQKFVFNENPFFFLPFSFFFSLNKKKKLLAGKLQQILLW